MVDFLFTCIVLIYVRLFQYPKLLFNCKYCILFAKYQPCQIVRHHTGQSRM